MSSQQTQVHEEFAAALRAVTEQPVVLLADTLAERLRGWAADQQEGDQPLRLDVGKTSVARSVATVRRLLEKAGEPLYLLVVGHPSRICGSICTTEAAVSIVEVMLAKARPVSVSSLSCCGGFTCDFDEETANGNEFVVIAWGSLKEFLGSVGESEGGRLSSPELRGQGIRPFVPR